MEGKQGQVKRGNGLARVVRDAKALKVLLKPVQAMPSQGDTNILDGDGWARHIYIERE